MTFGFFMTILFSLIPTLLEKRTHSFFSLLSIRLAMDVHRNIMESTILEKPLSQQLFTVRLGFGSVGCQGSSAQDGKFGVDT